MADVEHFHVRPDPARLVSDVVYAGSKTGCFLCRDDEDTGCAACGGDLDIDLDLIDDAKGIGKDGRLSGIHRRCT